MFGIHYPIGLAMLTQLRVDLSILNFHKCWRDFEDKIGMACPANDSFEDAKHCLLLYQPYEEPRRASQWSQPYIAS